jgi:branched-chain amino acid transport system ATP-binding protein
MNQPLLEIQDVCVAFQDIQILKNISLQIFPQEIVALVGPNGSGKTTLLRTIQGLIKPQAGRIYYRGQRIDRWETHRLVEAGIVYIPEGRRLFLQMTVKENLLTGAYTLRAKNNIESSLELVYGLFPDLVPREKQRAGTLSGGEQQMVAVGRGLMSRPDLLLLDDPFLGLSMRLIGRFCDTIRQIRGEGITIILVGQHVRRTLKLAGRAYLLESGQITLESTGPGLLADPHLQEVLL